jgi:hypothetical protein
MNRNVYTGTCHCSNITVVMELTRAANEYSPRACDCDFCRKHGASYVSDPLGRLEIRFERERHVSRYWQGSGNAECLVCRSCGVLIGACYRDRGRTLAAVNSRIFAEAPDFGSEVTVSPKALTEHDKIRRWSELWFADVALGPEGGASDP